MAPGDPSHPARLYNDSVPIQRDFTTVLVQGGLIAKAEEIDFPQTGGNSRD